MKEHKGIKVGSTYQLDLGGFTPATVLVTRIENGRVYYRGIVKDNSLLIVHFEELSGITKTNNTK